MEVSLTNFSGDEVLLVLLKLLRRKAIAVSSDRVYDSRRCHEIFKKDCPPFNSVPQSVVFVREVVAEIKLYQN